MTPSSWHATNRRRLVLGAAALAATRAVPAAAALPSTPAQTEGPF
jgi:hypothetical protein